MLNEANLARVDLNLLVVFEAVLKERHVGLAAEKLNLSPSAVSHALRRMRRLLNDPLFLRNPRGVVPTARATELAEPVADILARVRNVVATAAPFDPATSTRRFMIAAPDAVSAVLLPDLLNAMRRSAPGIDLGLRQALPAPGALGLEQSWQPLLCEIEAAAIDIALLPINTVPARFTAQKLYDEDFVVAMRAGHPLLDRPTLDGFCAHQHLVVSLMGDPCGFVDDAGKG
jgi:DNA-binding transcriptional LysR family regulator